MPRKPGTLTALLVPIVLLITGWSQGSPSLAGPPARGAGDIPIQGNATAAGGLSAPYPTTVGISLVWEIQGDDDLDGRVTAGYRAVGNSSWRPGPALMRVPAGSYQTFNWTNKHAGSIFDLEAATGYEVRLSLVDPDGGSTTRYLNVTTRAVPEPMPGAPVKTASPSNFSTVAGGAQAGDIILLENGSYAGFTFSRDGAPGQPIVIRGSGASIINDNIFADNTQHVMLDSLVINGTVKARGSQNFTMVWCTVTPAGGGPEDDGIILWSRSENGYISDNTVLGVTKWEESSLGASGNNSGEGIVVSGPGHVIRNNLVRGFRDGLSLMEDTQAFDQYSIDFLLNDVDQAADDGVEADFCFHNCRVVRNRITNVFMPLSSQPSLGGPLYFARNVVYNGLYEAVKLHRSSVGDVAVHNTFVMHGNAFGVYTSDVNSRQWYRNNIFLGGPGKTLNGYDTGPGLLMDLDPFDATSSFDYDAYGSEMHWVRGRFRGVTFDGSQDMINKTTEKNVSPTDFMDFIRPVNHPAQPFPALPPPDLRISSSAMVRDRGLRIPGINDAFNGAAPDIGAFEVGDPLPCWGPCPKKQKDTLPPTVPQNLVATAVSTSQIGLKWDPSSDNVGVAGYRLYRNGTQFATTALIMHSDTGLAANTTYTYNLEAYDAAGNPSGLSSPASDTTQGGGGGNNAPTLSPVGDRTVDEGKTLAFALQASDPDGDTIAFSAQGLPPNATLDSASGTFSFAPGYTQAAQYQVTFIADDQRGAGASDTSLITVNNVNRGPVAMVTEAQSSAKTGERVLLDGTPSHDPDGDALSFVWKQAGGPPAALENGTSAKASFIPLAEGVYKFELVVDDGSLKSAPASVTVTVSGSEIPPGPQAPGPLGLSPLAWTGIGVGAVLLFAALAAVLLVRRKKRPAAPDRRVPVEQWNAPYRPPG